MNEPNYEFSHIASSVSFEFDSISDTKIVKKFIEFSLVNSEISLYNLTLLDVLSDGFMSDLSVTNNQDMPKVLATVFKAVAYFFSVNQNATVFIEGSTKSRTRLYQIAIAKYLVQIEHKYSIWGFVGDDFEKFNRGKNYNSFILKLKQQ